MTLPTPSVDRGLTKLHLETPEPGNWISLPENRLRKWENKLKRIHTKLYYKDFDRALVALTELKDEIAATRKGVS